MRAIYFFILFIALTSLSCIPTSSRKNKALQISSSNESAININIATAEELEKLPGIGKVLANRIIEHRERYGRFRRAEHLMMVKGFSDSRFRRLQNYIRV
jgi:competence ComEA-like helix-hairpin-helix protein